MSSGLRVPRLLLISNSTMHGQGYLDHAEANIREVLGGARNVLFVPFALHDRAAYTERARARLAQMGYRVHAAEEISGRRSSMEEMDALFRRDRLMAFAFVGGLVVILPFTIIAMWGVVPSDGARAVLIGAACILATYNIASMVKLVQGYDRDRDFIYRRDVAHQRELKAARRAGGTA